MAKRDLETAARRGKLRELIKEYNAKTMEDVQNFVKMLMPETISERHFTTRGQVLHLYSEGVSTRDIQKTMDEMYGVTMDDSRVSKITDKICL